eukprot:772163-Rhodomonas_salina.2
MATKHVIDKHFETIQSVSSSYVTQQIVNDTHKLVYEIEDADEADDMNEYAPDSDARTILILQSG